MENNTSLIWIVVILLYLLVMGIFLFLWYCFCEVKNSYWQNRNVDLAIYQNRFDKNTNKQTSMEPKPHGARIKPKYNSDAKLYELEQNPAKR